MTVAPQAGSGSGRGELPRKGYGKGIEVNYGVIKVSIIWFGVSALF
jgi:hypothetical protein